VLPRLEAGLNIVGVCAARVVDGLLSVDWLARLLVGILLSEMGVGVVGIALGDASECVGPHLEAGMTDVGVCAAHVVGVSLSVFCSSEVGGDNREGVVSVGGSLGGAS
jgi:hypothetical protein